MGVHCQPCRRHNGARYPSGLYRGRRLLDTICRHATVVEEIGIQVFQAGLERLAMHLCPGERACERHWHD